MNLSMKTKRMVFIAAVIILAAFFLSMATVVVAVIALVVGGYLLYQKIRYGSIDLFRHMTTPHKEAPPEEAHTVREKIVIEADYEIVEKKEEGRN